MGDVWGKLCLANVRGGEFFTGNVWDEVIWDKYLDSHAFRVRWL